MLHKVLKGIAPVLAFALAAGISGCDGHISINGREGVPLSELDLAGKTPTDVVLAPAPPPRKPAREPQRAEPAPPPARPTVGALIVLSEPSGGTVYVNDNQVGQTPLTLQSLAPGAYRVRVELGSYASWSTPVQIDAGASEKLIAFMEKRGLP